MTENGWHKPRPCSHAREQLVMGPGVPDWPETWLGSPDMSGEWDKNDLDFVWA